MILNDRQILQRGKMIVPTHTSLVRDHDDETSFEREP